MADKHPRLPDDIQWHMIGHLQRNKVKYIAPFVDMVHSVDSMRLLKAIDSEAEKNDRVIDVLLQFKIAEEETKYGLDIDEFIRDFNALDTKPTSVRYRGVMGMASFVDDTTQVRREFKTLRHHYDKLRSELFTRRSLRYHFNGHVGRL